MSEKVTQLADRCGFPPKMRAAGETMCDELWNAIEKAEEAGVPLSMIIGYMELNRRRMAKPPIRPPLQQRAARHSRNLAQRLQLLPLG